MTREEQRARKAQQERMRQVERRHKEAARGQMDLPFLILTLLLTVIGLIMLFSASFPRAYYDTGDGTYYFKRQAAFAALGLVSMFIVSKINYQRWRGAGRLLVGLALFLLILVIIPHNPLAITSNNATRWLGIRGVFQFQPSEIAKLAVIVYFSDTISKKREKMLTWRQGILPYVALLAVIGVLMMLEPHLSGTVLIFATGAVLMIVGGIQGWLVAVGVGGVSALGFLFIKLRRPAGRGPGPGTAEVPVPAGAVQRLHLFRDLRGAGTDRRVCHYADLLHADPPGLLDRAPRPGPVRRAAGGGRDDPSGLADISEHRRGVRLRAHHGHLPPLLQLRRHGAVFAAGGDGHRAERIATDTGGTGGIKAQDLTTFRILLQENYYSYQNIEVGPPRRFQGAAE